MSFADNSLNHICALLRRPRGMLAYGDTLARRHQHARAFEQFARAARTGLPAAQYRLGRCYLLGQGVPPSAADAIRWLERAAAAGETAAKAELASLAIRGVTAKETSPLFQPTTPHSQEPDFHRAVYWGRLAAAAGSADSKALLGFILTAGPPALRDVAAGQAYYREAAEAGSCLGQFGLAIKLLEQGRPEANVQAQCLLRNAAKAGVPMAHYILGLMAEIGAAGVIDLQDAASFFQGGAVLGFPPAQLRYGLALLTGRGTLRNLFAGETWLRRAALAGEPEAATAIGDLYAQDYDTIPNYTEAAIWYGRAAEGGHAGAARMLGRFYAQGKGICPDLHEAAHWLRLAIERGDDAAYDDLARLALDRKVGERDQQTCFEWFLRNAEAQVPAAQFNLGLCLAYGIGTEPDEAAALPWFQLAAKVVPAAQVWVQTLLSKATPEADTSLLPPQTVAEDIAG